MSGDLPWWRISDLAEARRLTRLGQGNRPAMCVCVCVSLKKVPTGVATPLGQVGCPQVLRMTLAALRPHAGFPGLLAPHLELIADGT